MNILNSRKSKLAAAMLFFIIAVSVAVFEIAVYFSRPVRINPRSTDGQPIFAQPGVIQHIVTEFVPVVPSGRMVEVGEESTGTIQSAIDAAGPGDTVLVKNGFYMELLTLKDGIILRGEDCNGVVIQGDMRVAPVLKIENCKSVQVSDLTVRHFTEMPINETSKGNWAVVQIDNSGALLSRIVVWDSFTDGIRVRNDNLHLDHVIISECTVSNSRSAGIAVFGNGNVELKNNVCTNNKVNGIFLRDFTDGIITGNICRDNEYNGISVMDNAAAEVFANACSQNKYAGIWYGSNSPFSVKDNNCFDNGSSGIMINSQVAVESAGNNCSQNAVNGIYLMNGVSGNVSDNVCSQNKWHGISIAEDCAPRVFNNKCFGNRKCGIYDDGAMLGNNEISDNNEFCLQEVQMLLREENFEQLEKMIRQIRDEKRRFDNGNWQLGYFYGAFDIGYGSRPFEDNAAFCEKWIQRYPESVTARIAKAISLYRQAWSARGGGYSNTVSPEAWEPFKARLTEALEVLKEAEKLDANDPALYACWINVATGLGEMDDIEKAFAKGVEIEPTYHPLYYYHGFAYLPKWYGEPGQYARLAAEAADRTSDSIGQSLYFLLARKMVQQVQDVNEFRESGFNYGRVRQGMTDFEKQYPGFRDAEISNQLCFMACAAGDKEDARDYFLDIGDKWNSKVWRNRETFDKYRTWARNRDRD